MKERKSKQCAEDGIRQFLDCLGIDITNPALQKTPQRVTELYTKVFDGVGKNSQSIWGDIFPTEYEGLVSVLDIPFYSMCEHHLVPFFGTADIIYQPKDGRVAGLSKLGVLVDLFAHRPQLQERMTGEIADALERDLDAQGVLVRLKAQHLCMVLHGELPQGSQTVTLESRGSFKREGPSREEALLILGGSKYAQTTEI